MSEQNPSIVATQIGDVSVRKLNLGEFAELLRKVKKLPETLSSISEQSEEAIIAAIPQFIVDSMDEGLEIVGSFTDKTAEELKAIGLDDLILIVEAILEVNRYSEIRGFLERVAGKVRQKAASN